MELIKKLGTDFLLSGRRQSFGEFRCGECFSMVKRQLGHGKKQKNCGCAMREKAHGDTSGEYSKLFDVWSHMHKRCTLKNLKGYHNYGGRGIKVCEEWKLYKKFKEWALKNWYKEGLQIERVNNDGNYEPSNCRFTSHKQNNRNRRTTKLNWMQVGIIRVFCASGYLSRKRIAEIFNVSECTISDIYLYKRWKP